MPMDIDETIKFGCFIFYLKYIVFYGKQILQNLYMA